MLVLDTNTSIQGATTQYTNFDFNSMVNFKNRYLCASEDGLFEHTGSDDNESDISAYFEPLTMDFGLSNSKRVRSIYLGGEADGVLNILVNTENVSAVTLSVGSMTTQAARKIACERSLYGRYWTFRIANVDGCDFSIDSISVLPIILGHGRAQN